MHSVIHYAGEFTKPERLTQSLKNFMLFLYVSGFDSLSVTKNGFPHLSSPYPVPADTPFIALFPPGAVLEFSANARRKNWAVVFSSDDLHAKEDGFACTLNGAALSCFAEIPMKRLWLLCEEFSQLSANLNAGHLAGTEKAKLLLGALLGELFPDVAERNQERPKAAALKKAMDADERFTQTIGELNARLGLCSLPYMRKLFLEEYGILPGEYRNRQRLNRILELFSQTDDSLKMIADEVGMKHLPHLYAFLKERQELSPKELLNQFRGRKKR